MPLSEDSFILSSFRGMGFEPVLSRKRGTRGNPQPLAGFTDEFLRKITAKNPSLQEDIRRHWAEIVGDKFDGKCAPSNIRLGTLYITTCSASVRQELMFSTRTILAGIAKLAGGEKIKKIKLL